MTATRTPRIYVNVAEGRKKTGLILLSPYRLPKKINSLKHGLNGYVYPICPVCSRLFDVEYQPYCSECGQALDWNDLDELKRLFLLSTKSDDDMKKQSCS